MYFFIPPRFRAKPTCMVSHSWSTWLRQICFFPAATGLAGAVTAASTGGPREGGGEGEGGDGTPAIWIDVFAMPMTVVSSETAGRELCDLTMAVAKTVDTTFVVLPGEVRTSSERGRAAQRECPPARAFPA